jgi:hypothetical protein
VEEAVTLVVRGALHRYRTETRSLNFKSLVPLHSRLLCAVPFSAITKSATLAPKVEVYILLACRVHKPDIYHSSQVQDAFSKVVAPRAELFARTVESEISFPWAPIIPSSNGSLAGTTTEQGPRLTVLAERAIAKKPNSPCAADPTVQAAVARLSAGECLPRMWCMISRMTGVLRISLSRCFSI